MAIDLLAKARIDGRPDRLVETFFARPGLHPTASMFPSAFIQRRISYVSDT